MEKIKAVVCALFRHSRIITSWFGYQYCGRCGQQIGDTLGSIGIGLSVGIGHNCDKCKENYKAMTFIDKFLVPNPFTEDTK
jgi:hypothetical protein